MTSTITFRLCAPEQSWRLSTHHERRPTMTWPTKSGVVGLICNAMGTDRADTETIDTVKNGYMQVRIDNHGHIETEFHTINHVPDTTGTGHRTLIKHPEIIQDGCFAVAITYDDDHITTRIHNALNYNERPIYLGSRAFEANVSLRPETTKLTGHNVFTSIRPCDTHGVPKDGHTYITDSPLTANSVVTHDLPTNYQTRQYLPRTIEVFYQPHSNENRQ